jgi:hypothetical protein
MTLWSTRIAKTAVSNTSAFGGPSTEVIVDETRNPYYVVTVHDTQETYG